MANQIAANLAYLEDGAAATAVADHLRRFWSPEMRAELVEGREDEGLSPLAQAAAGLLETPAEG